LLGAFVYVLTCYMYHMAGYWRLSRVLRCSHWLC